jgi:hypothetical protein
MIQRLREVAPIALRRIPAGVVAIYRQPLLSTHARIARFVTPADLFREDRFHAHFLVAKGASGLGSLDQSDAATIRP